jgi:hypothetical protein
LLKVVHYGIMALHDHDLKQKENKLWNLLVTP